MLFAVVYCEFKFTLSLFDLFLSGQLVKAVICIFFPNSNSMPNLGLKHSMSFTVFQKLMEHNITGDLSFVFSIGYKYSCKDGDHTLMVHCLFLSLLVYTNCSDSIKGKV